MLKSLHLKNFRLFQDLKVDSLNRVNLIAGENNSGKTALLEALCLLFCDLQSFFKLPSVLRSDQGEDDFDSFWKWLFYQKSLAEGIEIKAVADNRATYVVTAPSLGSPLTDSIQFSQMEEGVWHGSKRIGKGGAGGGDIPPEWPTLSVFSTIPSSPIEDADIFNRIAAKRGGDTRVVELLQVIEPRLQDLKYLKLGRQALVYADVGMEDLIPTTQLGQGFTRLLRLFSEILVAKSEIVLIDEIENGIHYSALSKVWKGIATIARQEDLQIFATTHSYECIRYAHEAFSSEPVYDLALHRLERDDAGDVRAVTLDREALETSLKLEWEIR